MQLPLELRHRIEAECDGVAFNDLKRATASLSAGSHAEGCPQIGGKLRPLAYAVTRMPATIAAIHTVLSNFPANVVPRSVLDLRAGTGASWWALPEHWTGVSVRMLESDMSMLSLGRRLTPEGAWEQGDLRTAATASHELADVVLLSYSVRESGADPVATIETAWKLSRQAMVLIEVGTATGFDVVKAARDQLITTGARIAAPCPADTPCPMASTNDWCHFSARVERTSLHRRLKEGALGHEDEKFSYVIATRDEPGVRCSGRVVRHPKHQPGLITFPVCTGESIKSVRVTKRDERFKTARKLPWGGVWATD